VPLPPSDDVSYTEPKPTDLVSFSVLCRPASGVALQEFPAKLAAGDIRDLLPDKKECAEVSRRLKDLGFEVFDELWASPIVFARGPVALFEKVFKTTLVRMTRTSDADQVKRQTTGIVTRKGAPPPSTEPVKGAIQISLAPPPVLTEAVATASCLSLPDDVAHETNADDVHQERVRLRKAIGTGVTVAVVDTGFAKHPFFLSRSYHITRVAAPDTSDPEIDSDSHGTGVLANLLTCAPGVHAYGVKFGYPHIGFAKAMSIAKVRVISISWMYEIDANPLPDYAVALEYLIEYAVLFMGITVVVASGNDAIGETTPARLPHVIAVGGAAVVPSLQVWPRSTAFKSTVYGTRQVPDLCGIAAGINVPEPPSGLRCRVGTSYATPQVAGVASLLLQKNGTLTPSQVRNALVAHATDIKTGAAVSGVGAINGHDDATGGGLVNALASWQHVSAGPFLPWP